MPGCGMRSLALGLLVEVEEQRCQHTLDCGTFWVAAQGVFIREYELVGPG